MLFFYTAVLLCLTLFFLLALEWESVSATISSGEKAFLLKTNTGSKTSVRKRFFVNTVIFVFIATCKSLLSLLIFFCWCVLIITLPYTAFYELAVEHCMSVVYAVANAYVCSAERPLSKSYATQQFAQIFDFTGYAPWKALLIQVNKAKSSDGTFLTAPSLLNSK